MMKIDNIATQKGGGNKTIISGNEKSNYKGRRKMAKENQENILKTLRTEKGLSVDNVSAKTGISVEEILKNESDLYSATIKNLLQYANLYQVRIDYLLGLTSHKNGIYG